MKNLFTVPLLAALASLSIGGTASAQPNINLSIGINQPGVYGRVDIGNAPRPLLVRPEPVIVAPPTVHVERQPIYLYVPPEHQRDWNHHCGRYAACGQPVYFVQEQWVRDRYEHAHPGWEHRHDRWEEHREDRREERWAQRREERRDDRREWDNRHGRHD